LENDSIFKKVEGYYEDQTIKYTTTIGPEGITGEYIMYHKNGKKSQISNYVNGLLNGKTSAWDENGNLLYEMNFLANKLNGKFTTYLDGNKHICMYYINGLLNGKYEVFSPSSNKIQLSNYLNNQLNGETLYLNESNGNTIKKVTYLNGKLNGSSVTYFPNMIPMEEEYYKDGLLDGVVYKYYPNGHIRESTGYCEGKKLYTKEYGMDGKEAKGTKGNEKTKAFHFVSLFGILKSKGS
jgi:antitoxin component YwqK of YwqJK toxin-antitoxin module